MVIQVGIRLILYTDQAITRSMEESTTGSENTNDTNSSSTYGSRGESSASRKGIDNTVSFLKQWKTTVNINWCNNRFNEKTTLSW